MTRRGPPGWPSGLYTQSRARFSPRREAEASLAHTEEEEETGGQRRSLERRGRQGWRSLGGSPAARHWGGGRRPSGNVAAAQQDRHRTPVAQDCGRKQPVAFSAPVCGHLCGRQVRGMHATQVRSGHDPPMLQGEKR